MATTYVVMTVASCRARNAATLSKPAVSAMGS
jgi:hypothetical protein